MKAITIIMENTEEILVIITCNIHNSIATFFLNDENITLYT